MYMTLWSCTATHQATGAVRSTHTQSSQRSSATVHLEAIATSQDAGSMHPSPTSDASSWKSISYTCMWCIPPRPHGTHTYRVNSSSMDCIPLTARRSVPKLQTRPSRVGRVHCTLYTQQPLGNLTLGSWLKEEACSSVRSRGGCSWVGGDPPGSTSSGSESGTVAPSAEL